VIPFILEATQRAVTEWPFGGKCYREGIVRQRGDGRLTARGEGYKHNMGLLSLIIVGLIAGFLAKYVVPGEGPGGVVGDIIIGVIGAFIGGWIFTMFGHTGLDGLSLWSIIVAFVGAVVLLFILRAITGRRATY
jgi:uncharacterized membrane protein YeaQ/YmgE (transglycosylase-associated protein family)